MPLTLVIPKIISLFHYSQKIKPVIPLFQGKNFRYSYSIIQPPNSKTDRSTVSQIILLIKSGEKILILNRLLAVPFWLVERFTLTARRDWSEEKYFKYSPFPASPQAPLRSFAPVFSRSVRAPSRLSRKGLLAVYILNENVPC